MPYNLRELGINSEYRAAELEHELGLTFNDFTPEQLDTWQRQTVCLNQYALTRTYSSAARTAGVTVYTVEAWERDNELEFVRRKEMADREFCDGLEELLLERTRMPDSPPSLLTAVLRAQMPEKYRGSRYERDPDDGEQNGEFTPLEQTSESAEFTPAPDPSDHAPESAGLYPTPNPSDHVTESAGLKPAPGPSGEDTPTGDKPRHPEPSTRISPNLNRRQRRELQRRAKRNGQNSHRARAPN